MKDTVKLVQMGSALGFTVPSVIIKDLELSEEDSVQVEIIQIFKEGIIPTEVSVFTRRHIGVHGSGS